MDAALVRLAREDGPRVTALLAGRFGDVEFADDVVQDALLRAVERWPLDGVPRNPGGWLHTVARNLAVDRLRRAAAADRRLRAAAPDLDPESRPRQEADVPILEEGEVGDEQLRLVLLCCHPALAPDAQVALTLRLVGGLTVPEIAAAFLVPEATIAQRLIRAKRKIRVSRIPFVVPADLAARVGVLLRVLLLIFNEGYLSRGDGGPVLRTALADEAIRLTRTVHRLLPDDPEPAGLLALQLYLRARWASRVDPSGALALLAEQDRGTWDLAGIEEANGLVRGALAREVPGPFQVHALIASLHANAPSFAATDWLTIAALYARLRTFDPNPLVVLNHAVAVAHAEGPHVALPLLDGLRGLDRYHLLHATRGELLLRAGDATGATDAFGRALALATSEPERRHLTSRLAAAARAAESPP